jgi:hypothetical protein
LRKKGLFEKKLRAKRRHKNVLDGFEAGLEAAVGRRGKNQKLYNFFEISSCGLFKVVV